MKTKTKMTYDNLALVPRVIAKTVCEQPYRGNETQSFSSREVQRLEIFRQKMTKEQVEEFCEIADQRCRFSYEQKSDWFMKCVRSQYGRDQLYVWISHWLAAYLTDPFTYKQRYGAS